MRQARPRDSGASSGGRTGQVVVAQIALALLIAAVGTDLAWLAVAGPIATILLVGAFGRFGGRWAYQWAFQGLRHLTSHRGLSEGSDATALLGLVRPAATITSIEFEGVPVGVVEDAFGLTAVVEVGDTTALLAEAMSPLPSPESLLPTAVADQPVVRLQLLFTGVAAPAAITTSAAAATSYRQLTEGRILAQQRVLIAVHVRRSDGFDDADLRRCLTSAVRRVRRRLDRAELPCRGLNGPSLLRALSDAAHHDPAHPVRESWSGIDLGGLRHVGFRLTQWPDPRGELSRILVPRLLTLPGGGTTVSLTIERERNPPGQVRAELLIRIAAASPALLGAATEALRALLAAAGASGRRLDGAHLAALAATLPLGGAAHGPATVLSGLVSGFDSIGLWGKGLPKNPAALGSLEAPVGGAGMMLGVNRHGAPVILRLFRPEPTRAALIGGLRCAQHTVLRALALGARVVVQSGRPHAWEPFLRGVSGHGTSVITMVAPGRTIEPPPASPVRPQLMVIDVGPVAANGIPVVESAWRTTLLVRDDLNQSDLDLLARADLALLQPLAGTEASVAAAALGLGESASWLTKIRGDMVGVVVARRTLRWALLSGTPLERQLIGPPTR